jgi:DNA-binding transcriptional regulator YhcF (GntR family)
MTITWNDSVPIYRQLRERVVAMILDGALNEGDPLPSVRQVAADFQINPLTVSKAYQELVDAWACLSSMEPGKRCSNPSARGSCARNGLRSLPDCSASGWT